MYRKLFKNLSILTMVVKIVFFFNKSSLSLQINKHLSNVRALSMILPNLVGGFKLICFYFICCLNLFTIYW